MKKSGFVVLLTLLLCGRSIAAPSLPGKGVCLGNFRYADGVNGGALLLELDGPKANAFMKYGQPGLRAHLPVASTIDWVSRGTTELKPFPDGTGFTFELAPGAVTIPHGQVGEYTNSRTLRITLRPVGDRFSVDVTFGQGLVHADGPMQCVGPNDSGK